MFGSVKFAAAAAILAGGVMAASAQSAPTFSGLRVDLSSLPVGATETRAQLQACLNRELQRAFTGRIQPGTRGAPVLVVRPTVIWLSNGAATNIRDGFGGGDGSSSMDSMEGEVSAGGRRVPLHVAANGDTGANGFTEQGARVRTETLCQSFAYWAARRI